MYSCITKTNKHFILLKDELEVGSLQYPSWNISKVVLNLSSTPGIQTSAQYQYTPIGFWRRDATVLVNGEPVLDITCSNWRLKRTITTSNASGPQYFSAYEGWFSREAVLYDANGNKLYSIAKKFSWRKWGYEFTISNFATTNSAYDSLLLLVLLHLTLLDMRRSAAASA
jgi:hypothetical protein